MAWTVHNMEWVYIDDDTDRPLCGGACGVCKIISCRCADCFALDNIDGVWVCDLAGKPCKEVEKCGEFTEVQNEE